MTVCLARYKKHPLTRSALDLEFSLFWKSWEMIENGLLQRVLWEYKALAAHRAAK